jgi:hypothetical protein
MVSKTLASLDAWLAQAEEVLAEQRRLSEQSSELTFPREAHQPTLFADEGPSLAVGA